MRWRSDCILQDFSSVHRGPVETILQSAGENFRPCAVCTKKKPGSIPEIDSRGRFHTVRLEIVTQPCQPSFRTFNRASRPTVNHQPTPPTSQGDVANCCGLRSRSESRLTHHRALLAVHRVRRDGSGDVLRRMRYFLVSLDDGVQHVEFDVLTSRLHVRLRFLRCVGGSAELLGRQFAPPRGTRNWYVPRQYSSSSTSPSGASECLHYFVFF